MRRILGCQISTCKEALYLETGSLSIGTIIKSRRIKFLHFLLNLDENEVLSKFFVTQAKYPVKNDWTTQVKEDLNDFSVAKNITELKKISKEQIKKFIKIKSLEYELKRLNTDKETHSKMKDLHYSELKLQEYLKLKIMTIEEAKLVFKFRTRQAEFSENFRGTSGPANCILCNNHLDNQPMSFQCSVLNAKLKLKGKYEDIFEENISKDIVRSLKLIDRYREKSKD